MSATILTAVGIGWRRRRLGGGQGKAVSRGLRFPRPFLVGDTLLVSDGDGARDGAWQILSALGLGWVDAAGPEAAAALEQVAALVARLEDRRGVPPPALRLHWAGRGPLPAAPMGG